MSITHDVISLLSDRFGELNTVEEISCFTTKLRLLSDNECRVVFPDILQHIRDHTKFYDTIVELYRSVTDLQFRRDVTFLLRRLGYFGALEDHQILLSKFVMRLILTDCVESSDEDLIVNIVTVLRDVSYKNDFQSLAYLVDQGLYHKLIQLLETWKSHFNIAERLLNTIQMICSHEKSLTETNTAYKTLITTASAHKELILEVQQHHSSCKMTVKVAQLLYDDLGAIEESAVLKLLIPEANILHTTEGIAKLAGHINGVSEAVAKLIMNKLYTDNFIGEVCKKFNNDSDVMYQRNLMMVVAKFAELGDHEAIRSLVKSGLVAILMKFEECNDSMVVWHISTIFLMVAFDNNFGNVAWLAKHGMLPLLYRLIKMWKEEQGCEFIVGNLLGVLANLTTKFENLEKIAGLAVSDINLPKLLISILETSTHLGVVQNTIYCIRNMVKDTTCLHKHFSTQNFIDTCFRHLKSESLSSQYKVNILRNVVTQLTIINPSVLTPLLISHAHYIRELAELSVDTDLSLRAATLINTYLSCDQKRHKCRFLGTFLLLKILKFVCMYTLDIVSDLRVGINAIYDADADTRYEGYLLIIFGIVPLIYLNQQSIQRFYISCFRAADVDPVVSLDGSNRGKILRYVFPWHFDSLKHFCFNILTCLQLHPLVTAIELALHHQTREDTFMEKKFFFNKVSTQEKVLENIPALLIKSLILYKYVEKMNYFNWDHDQIFTLLSTIYGFAMLCYKLSSFENLCRSTDSSPSTLETKFTAVSFIAIMISVLSRLAMCIAFYCTMKENNTLWIFIICMVLHLLLTFSIHLFSYHKWYSPYTSSESTRFVIKSYIIEENDIRNSIPVMIGRTALVFCLSWSESFIANLRHPIDLVSSAFPSTHHLRSQVCFFLIYLFNLLEVVAVTILANTLGTASWINILGYVSLAMYVSSGLLYALYLTVFEPDENAKLPSTSLNPRFKHLGYQLQTNKMYKFCHVTEEGMEINGQEVLSPTDYNYRLQVLDPCFYCMSGRKCVTEDGMETENCCSVSTSQQRIQEFFAKLFSGTDYERIPYSGKGFEEPEYRLKELNFLMKKVDSYKVLHRHLLPFLPGINTVKEEDLNPNLVPTCARLKENIHKMFRLLTNSEILDDTMFEQYEALCCKFFFLKEQEWENKILKWCETAPTKIYFEHFVLDWESPRFKKDMKKWEKKRKKLAVLKSIAHR